MKDALVHYKNKGLQRWRELSGRTKIIIFGSVIVVVVAAIFIAIEARPDFVPLYSHLSEEETGQIKESLDSKGVPSQISENGTTIAVPKDQVDTLKVELASEGIPKSGQIDYASFGDNSGFGMTDKEFDVMNKAAMQNELGDLIAGVNGIKAANVMLTLPEDSVWVSDDDEKASASVVLKLETGTKLKQKEVASLYHLISKSVSNLPVDHIVIMDEMFNAFDPVDEDSGNSALSAYQQNHEVKQDVEKDLQEQVQRMLGMMMGQDKVMVSVTTDIDFTKEKDKEKRVEPVDEKNNEGLKVSEERIRESYAGKGDEEGGVPGTGDEDVPGYVEKNEEDGGDYQRDESRINNEFNRIHKDIEKNPYTIQDLGIQVMVEPPDPKNPSSLSQAREDDIHNILATLIRTTLPKDVGQEETDEDIDDKVSLSVQSFQGRVNVDKPEKPGMPIWIYITAALLLLVIALLIYLLLRRRRLDDEEEYADLPPPPVTEVEDPNIEENEREEDIRRRQLEQMAKEQPEEFTNLLRSWLSDDEAP